MPNNEEFLYDDFFSPQNAPGIPATVEVRGRELPFRFRLLSFGEVKALLMKSARVTLSEDGTPNVEMKENAVGDDELLLAVIRSWPFKNADGSMVEINSKTLSEMHPDVMIPLLKRVTDFVNNSLKAHQEGINGPFGKP